MKLRTPLEVIVELAMLVAVFPLIVKQMVSLLSFSKAKMELPMLLLFALTTQSPESIETSVQGKIPVASVKPAI